MCLTVRRERVARCGNARPDPPPPSCLKLQCSGRVEGFRVRSYIATSHGRKKSNGELHDLSLISPISCKTERLFTQIAAKESKRGRKSPARPFRGAEEPPLSLNEKAPASFGPRGKLLPRRWPLPIPAWTEDPSRFLRRPYFTTTIE